MIARFAAFRAALSELAAPDKTSFP